MKITAKTCPTCGSTNCTEHSETSSLESIAPSCNIKGLSDREEAFNWLKENFYPQINEVNELETGYELVFKKPTKEFTEVILDVFRQEMECCPAFSLALIIEPNKEHIHYQYFGSESIKQEMEEAFKFVGVLK